MFDDDDDDAYIIAIDAQQKKRGDAALRAILCNVCVFVVVVDYSE